MRRVNIDKYLSKKLVNVVVNFPGLEKEDVRIDLYAGCGILLISCQKQRIEVTGNTTSRKSCSATLPIPVDGWTKVSDVKAKLENGVLTVECPCSQVSKWEEKQNLKRFKTFGGFHESCVIDCPEDNRNNPSGGKPKSSPHTQAGTSTRPHTPKQAGTSTRPHTQAATGSKLRY